MQCTCAHTHLIMFICAPLIINNISFSLIGSMHKITISSTDTENLHKIYSLRALVVTQTIKNDFRFEKNISILIR